MLEMKTCFILFLILAFLLCGCQNITQGADEPSDMAESQTDDPRSQMEIFEEEKAQILAFLEAHEDELEAIALDFIEFERENAECDYPYAGYQLQWGLIISDGFGNTEEVESPALEQQLEHIFALSDCPFKGAWPSTYRDWLDTDFCEFSAPSSSKEFSISLIYLPDAEFEIPNWIDCEHVVEHWVIVTNWNE